MAKSVPELTLNDGHKIPVIGLGTWQAKPGEVQQAVENGIDVGYRHFDCALAYENEAEIGNAIEKKIKEGVVKREELFVTTKLPPTLNEPTLVRTGLKASMDQLKLKYIDLYLIHFPVSIDRDYLKTLPPGSAIKTPDEPTKFFRNVDLVQVWKEMEKLVDEGLVKSIGVSNFTADQIQKLMNNSRIKPSVNQIEVHAYFPQEDLFQFCKKHGIVVEAYSPIGSPTRFGGSAGGAVLLDEPTLATIGQKYSKSPAQILLKNLLQRGMVVLPKSVNKDRLKQNFDLWDFDLTDQDMQAVAELSKKGGRLFSYKCWKDSPTFPF